MHAKQIGPRELLHGLRQRVEVEVVGDEQAQFDGVVGNELRSRGLQGVELALCPIEVSTEVRHACVAELGFVPQGVVLEVEVHLRKHQRRVPNQVVEDVDVAKGEFARRGDAFVQVVPCQQRFQRLNRFVGTVQVEGKQVGAVLHHHGGLRPHPEVAQPFGVSLGEIAGRIEVDWHLRRELVELHLEHFVARREEVRIVLAFGRHVAIARQGRGFVSVGVGRMSQFHEPFALLLEPQIECLGMGQCRGEILDLVEVPNQQLREDGVVGVGLDGAQKRKTHKFTVVLDGRQTQIAVEAVLNRAEVIGLLVQQVHVRIDHAFEVAPHPLKVRKFVFEVGGAELGGLVVGGQRHVQLVKLDECVRQGDRGASPFLKLVEGFDEGFLGCVLSAKVKVQGAQVDQRRGSGGFVPALQAVFDQLFGRLKVVQRQQRGVVHLVDGVGLVLLPNGLQVQPGLGVASFVVVELGQFHVRLPRCAKDDEVHHACDAKPCESLDEGRHSVAAICWAHSARFTRMRESIEARVVPSSKVPASTMRLVSANVARQAFTASISRCT